MALSGFPKLLLVGPLSGAKQTPLWQTPGTGFDPIDEITVTACRAGREVQPVAVDEITVTISEFYLAHVLFEEATKAFPETKFFRRSLPKRQTSGPS